MTAWRRNGRRKVKSKTNFIYTKIYQNLVINWIQGQLTALDYYNTKKK